MFSKVARGASPRWARGVSQLISDATVWNQAPAKVSTLPNGLRVATRTTFAEVSSAGIFIDAGSRDETKDTCGVSQLVDRLALTGTAKRSKAQLAAEVQSLGATLNVATGREHTAYTMTSMGKNVKQSVDILGDLVSNPGVANYAKEKEAALRDLANASELPTRDVIDDRLHSCAFRDSGLGFSRVGPFEGIENTTQGQLQAYVDANHSADKMVLSVVGPCEHEEVVAQAAAALGGLKAASVPRPLNEKPYFCGAELIYRNDEMGPLAFISVGWEGVAARSPDAVSFMIMKHIIGNFKKGEGVVPGNISGNRVTNAVSNKMGVGCAEEFGAFNLMYKDTGMFGWYAVCDEVAVEHCTGEMMFGANLLSFSVTDEEVERAKRELKLELFGGCGSTEAACADLGKQVLLYGRNIPAAEWSLRIDAVDAEEIKRVAYENLNDSEISVTGLGPLHGMPMYVDLRRATTMHRY